MRELSLVFRRTLTAQESGEIAALLLTITHSSTDHVYRFSTDPTQRLSTDPLIYGTQSRGDDFYYVPAKAQLPDEMDKAPPRSRLILPNIDRSLIPLVRSITTPPKVKIEGILVSDPDIVEFEVAEMDMINVEYDADKLTFELAIDALVTESFPSGSFDPASFPGLFVQ